MLECQNVSGRTMKLPKMTFDDKVGIGLGWQTTSEKDGEILIINGM